ncbi:MAG: hypothetical protein JNN00_18990 [Chitinophagaceae bacterium]|nr:hypothetical protein [Chitinophagaceae bacterium]
MRYKHKVLFVFIGMSFVLFTGSLYASSAFPAAPAVPPGSWKNIRVSMIVGLSVNDFNRVSGHKLSPVQKIAFSVMKKKMKKALTKNPELTAGEFYEGIRTLEKIWLITLIGLAVLLLLVILLLARI